MSESGVSEGVEAVDPPASKRIKSITDVVTQMTRRGTRVPASDRLGRRPRPQQAGGLEVQWHLQAVDKGL
eukprot:361927-Chlamydomonas_euryale.AAC.2